jgi:TP901 family phage tail tape measure protein
MDYSPAAESTENFAHQIAQLELRLAKLHAASQKGVLVPHLQDVSQLAAHYRQLVTSGVQLNETQQKGLLVAREYASVENLRANTNLLLLKLSKESVQQAYAKMYALQAEAAQLQRTMRHRGLESTEIYKQIDLYRQKLTLMEASRASGEKSTTEIQLQTQEIERQMGMLKSQARTMMADAPGAEGKSETFWERRFGWFVAGSVFYGTLRAGREMVENAKNIESSMTLIRRISNETTADFGAMQKALLDLGVQYGHTWDVVSDVAERWARSGYSVRDTLKLTETALITLNTAELNAVQATESMIAIMSQWGMTADDLPLVLDKVTKAADNYAVSSADLIQGLSRSSGAAKLWNMSLNDTITILTILRESTGRTGNEIGNVLNTLLAFMKRPETIKAFESVGIDIYTDRAGSHYRNIMAIFAELSEKLPSMSAKNTQAIVDAADAAGLFTEEVAEAADAVDLLTLAQQQNITTAAAGTRRQNYLIALLNNWAKTDSVLLDLEDALGYSLRSNAMAMETYEKKIEQFRASWQQLSTVFMESGVIDLMKSFTDAGTGMISFLNDLPKPLQAAIGALATYASVMAMVNLAMKTFGSTTLVQGLSGLFGTMGLAVGGLPALLAVGGGLALGTGVVAAVKQQQEYNRQLELMADAYFEVNQKVKELERSTIDYRRALDEHGDAYIEANENLNELEGNTEEYNRALDAQQTILNEIGSKYPHLVLQVDDLGNVVELSIDPLEKMSDKMKNAAEKTENLEERLRRLKEELAGMADAYNKGEVPDKFIDKAKEAAYYQFAMWYGAEEARSMVEGDIAPDPYSTPNYRVEQFRAMESHKEAIRSVEEELARRESKKAASSGDGSDKIGFDLENWRKQFLMLEDPSIEIALTNIRRDLKLLALEEEKLRDTMMDEAKAKELSAEKSRLLARENELLSASNGQLYNKLSMYNRAQAEANAVLSSPASAADRERAIQAYNEAGNQIKSLTSKIAENTIKMRENEIAIVQSGHSVTEYYRKIREEQQRSLDDMFRTRKTFFQHEVDLGRANRDAQIRFWREMLNVYRDDADKRMEIEKKLHALYKSGLEEQMKLAERAYQERIKQIESEAEARIRAIQAEIDALDDEGEQSEREEAARQHADKIKDIEDQIRYHSLRVGREHEKAIADLQKQKSEEQIRWQLQQDKWAREDRKDVLRKRIEDIREYANRQKEELQRAWEDAKEIFQNEANTILATAAIYDEMWYERGLEWITQLAQGMSAGTGAIRAILDSIGMGGSGIPDIKGRSQALLDAKRAWERAHASGDAEGMRRAAEAGAAIRASGPTLDPGNDLSGDELEDAIRRATFHVGGTNLRTGWALLAEREHVLTASLSTKLGEFLDKWESGVTTHIIYNIDKMVGIENAHFEDRSDMYAFANIIGRRVEILNTARGAR